MKLHDYQVVARDHLVRNARAGLLLDMGLGKTAAALSALKSDHLPALVVAPKRVAENVWPHEAKLWRPDLRVAVAAGAPAARRRALASEADLVVIGRDNLSDALDRDVWRTLILDELSGFKSRASQRWKTAKKITTTTPHVWGLTGTPAPNGLLDLWAQIYLLDNGRRLGPTLSGYRSRYFVPGRQLANGVITEWILRPEAERRIHESIEDICLSMSTIGRIDLPPVTYNEIEVPMSPATRRVYKDLRNTLVVDLDVLGGSVHTAPTAAALSNRLSQISAGFLYPDEADGGYDVVHTDKIMALREVIDGTGSPVLVFYRYRAEAEMIVRELGSTVRRIEEHGVIDEWNAGRVPVLLAHPASAGHGLNLQHGGHTIVWTSLPWSLEEWEQANKRLARQGQKHPVVIHSLMTSRSVDYAIRDALASKTSVQQALLAHLESAL